MHTLRRCVASTMQQSSVSLSLKDALQRIQTTTEKSGRQKAPRLVAVSKTKPVEMLKEAYDAGQRVFGENYVQEILEKVPQLPEDISWHFIGHLQSNKAKSLIEGVPNLAMLETVDSVKLANKLDNAVSCASRAPLPVMVQVNTSGEESKFGLDPAETLELARHIQKECHFLRLAGLMTVGNADYTSTPDNFKCLADCRERISSELGIKEEDLELSMGMSGDFEPAIGAGSTNVRLGSTIFGKRDYMYSKPQS